MNYIPPPKELTRGSIVDVYLRDSGGEGQERSVESQLAEVREYCKAHHLTLRTIYRDEAKSGRTTAGRNDFKRMIADYQSGHNNPRALLIWDYARFGRNADEANWGIVVIEHEKVIVHSITDNILEGPYKQLGRVLKHSGNQAQSESNSAAVKRMQHQLVKNHKAMFSAPPRGFMREPLPPIRNERTGEIRSLNKWIPDPALASLVLRAFEMRADGKTIFAILEATGLYKSTNCYTTFFKNKLYKGVLEFGDMTITDYCEPIVPPELWDKVNAMRKNTRTGNRVRNPRRITSRYLLSGIIHCQQCGAALVGHRIGQWDYYACPTRKRTRDCNAAHLPKNKIEHGILESIQETFTLERILNLQGHIAENLQRTEHEAKAARLKLDRDAVTVSKGIANLTKSIAKRGDSESLLEALDALEAQQKEIKQQIHDLEKEIYIPRHKTPELKAIANELNRIVTSGSFEEQQTLIRTFITRITAAKQENEILAKLYYLPIKILTRHNNGLGLHTVPPRELLTEEQYSIVIKL